MSPLLRDELHIALNPETVVLERLRRGLRSAEAVEKRVVACTAAGADEAPWAKVLEGLEAGLSAMNGGKADAQMVLSNHFVRYALVPWSGQISDRNEELAFVRHCFTRTYGDGAQQWILRMSPNGYGETQVASAVDQGLLEGLERVAQTHGVRLISLQPNLMFAFNRWRHRLQGSAVWFVVCEPGRLCMSRLQQGGWHCLRSIKIGDDWQQELQKQLDREFLISESGTERGTVYVHAPGNGSAIKLAGWMVHLLNAEQVAEPHAADSQSESSDAPAIP